MRIEISVLLIVGALLCGRNVNAALTDCTSGASACDPLTNAQDGYCETSYAHDSCLCNHLYTQTGTTPAATCALKACNTPATDCGTNTVCDTSSKCSCLATHVPTVASGATVTTCTRHVTDCSAHIDCTGAPINLANSYCLTTGTDRGCYCAATFSASDSACAQTTCTQASIPRNTCGSNTVCGLTQNAYKCQCAVNYEANEDSCTQKACTISNVATNCGFTHVCTDSKCECSSDYVASGTMCKRNCSANAYVCHVNADCIDGLCECRVNYVGNGATCTALTCSGTDPTTCHPNSQCSGSPGTCSCAQGWTANGTVCAKACNENTVTGNQISVLICKVGLYFLTVGATFRKSA